MYLGACDCDTCDDTHLGYGAAVAVAIQVAAEVVSGALKRAAHKRAKRQAWELALQRIPEDEYVDYASYVKHYPDLYDAWKSGSWKPAGGGTIADMGLIHIREFGPRTDKPIPLLKGGTRRPDPGPSNGFKQSWPVAVLQKLKPLAAIIPSEPGINAPQPVAKASAQNPSVRSSPRPASVRVAGLQIPIFVPLVGGAVLLLLLLKR